MKAGRSYGRHKITPQTETGIAEIVFLALAAPAVMTSETVLVGRPTAVPAAYIRLHRPIDTLPIQGRTIGKITPRFERAI